MTCPRSGAALPLAPVVAAARPCWLHAANTSIDAPASAVSFRNFIQYSSSTRIDRRFPVDPRSVHPPAPARASGPAQSSVARCSCSRGSLTSGRGELTEALERAAVRDGRRRRIPARAARRMPPKRCRIICIGGPIATPTSATRAWLSSLPLATPRGPAGTGADPDRNRHESRDRRPYEVAPDRVEYLVRTARITDIDRLVALSGGVIRSSGCVVRSIRRTCSDSSSTFRRPASSSPRSDGMSSAGRSSPSGRPSAPAASWGRWTCSWSIPTTMRSRDRRPHRGSPPFGTEQGLQRRGSGAVRGSGGADPLGTSRVHRKRSAHGTAGGRGRGRRSPGR